LFDFAWRRSGAVLNVVALALFVLTVAGAAFAWRRRHSPSKLP
jgi:hypothetical protein